MTQDSKELLVSLMNNMIYAHDIGLMRAQCSICRTIQSIDMSKYSNVEAADMLINDGWHIINNTIYCPKCKKQHEELMNIAQNNIRPDKINYYLNIAKEVCTRATCLRRKYGAVLIKNDTIISTGYNGSPRGTANCIDLGECRRERLNIPRGQCYEMCRSLHAEQNCIINASRNDMIDSDLYLYGMNVDTNNIVDDLDSCQLCKKMIINAGIKRVIFARPNNQYEIKDVSEWVMTDETLTDKFGY